MGTHPIFESDFDCLTEFKKMPLEETIYSTSQISIPAELPDLLKQYTKAAIRTQPPDILQWSAAYFSSLANGDPLPVKRRLEPVVVLVLQSVIWMFWSSSIKDSPIRMLQRNRFK